MNSTGIGTMHRLARGLSALALTAIASGSLFAQGIAGGTEGDFEMRDFRFTDGSTLPVLRIHYTTLGKPKKDARGRVTNAVLILHGTTGSGRGFLSRNFGGELFQPGQPLDTTSHFIILPDGIGTGKSSRPSEGLHAKFPRYGYEDMVTAQYRLVTEGLGVNHLLLVMARRWARCTRGCGASAIRTSWTVSCRSRARRRRSRAGIA